MGTNLAAIAFIFMVPNTAALSPANAESLSPTNPYIIKLLKWADMYNPNGDSMVEEMNQKAIEVKIIEDLVKK
jgi:hypothetical protein